MFKFVPAIMLIEVRNMNCVRELLGGTLRNSPHKAHKLSGNNHKSQMSLNGTAGRTAVGTAEAQSKCKWLAETVVLAKRATSNITKKMLAGGK